MKIKFAFNLILLIGWQVIVLGQNSTVQSKISVGEKINLRSEILGETREIYLHRPPGFWGMDEAQENLPLIIVLDAESQFLHTVATVDFLSSAPLGNDLIPRSVVVGIPNINRNRDLTPVKGLIANDSTTLETSGGGKQFLNFICEELIPHLDSAYGTSGHRTIIGHSLGGLITFEALLRKRDYFTNYLAIDPALGFADGTYLAEILDTLQQADLSNEHLFHASAVTKPTFLTEEELLQDDSDINTMMGLPNRKFAEAKEESQWTLHSESKHFPDENHFSVPQRASYDALRYFYRYYSFPEMLDYYHPMYKDKSDLVDRLKEHYKMLTTKMGCEVLPMEGYINSFAWGIAPTGRIDLALDLFEYNIALHPENPMMYNNLAYFHLSRGNKPAAVKAFKRSVQVHAEESILIMIRDLENEIEEEGKD